MLKAGGQCRALTRQEQNAANRHATANSLVIAFAALAMGVALTACGGGAGYIGTGPPTQPKQLALTLHDMPIGWTVAKNTQSDPGIQNGTGWERLFQRPNTLSGLLVVVSYALSFTSEQRARVAMPVVLRQATSGLSGFSATPMSAPSVGEQSEALSLSGTFSGVSESGEAVVVRVHRYLAFLAGVGRVGYNQPGEILPLVRKQATLLESGR